MGGQTSLLQKLDDGQDVEASRDRAAIIIKPVQYW